MIVHNRHPLNAEPSADLLMAGFHTAQSHFYVRNHGGIPDAGPADRLRVGGLVATPLDLSVDGMRQRFAHHTVTATLQCAGNRRADLQPVGKTTGDPWAAGAIGTADWTGVRLADVLEAAGLATGARHVGFHSRDMVTEAGATFAYAVSIPLSKATAPEVLLAWAMNGEELTPEHGAPLRAIVPGYAGVRSAKWLSQVAVAERPVDCPMQHSAYKLFPPDVTKETVDWKHGVTINALPLNSAICVPRPGPVRTGPVMVQGWAFASDRAVTRVDVSSDGGCRWQQARLDHPADAPWAWTLWRTTLDLPPGLHELVVRAWDDAGQTQPSDAAETWNFKGYLSAAWHRVRVLAE